MKVIVIALPDDDVEAVYCLVNGEDVVFINTTLTEFEQAALVRYFQTKLLRLAVSLTGCWASL